MRLFSGQLELYLKSYDTYKFLIYFQFNNVRNFLNIALNGLKIGGMKKTGIIIYVTILLMSCDSSS